MAVTLEWIRDNYDANKNRYIDGTEGAAAVGDWFNNKITTEQRDAVISASNNNTLLPAYSTPTTITCNGTTPNFSSGCALLLHYDAGKDGVISATDMSAASIDEMNGAITDSEKDFVRLAYNAGSINALCAGCYSSTPPQVCTPGTRRCRDANTVEQCRADGSGWDIAQVCATGYECQNGACVQSSIPTTVTLEWIRDNYDANKNRYIDGTEGAAAVGDWFANKISDVQRDAVIAASDNNTLLPAYSTPTPPPGMETRTVSLTEGTHTIQVSLNGYDTLNATINVTSSGVTCVSVIGGACGGSGLPRVSTSGLTVSTYLKEVTTTSSYATWLAGKGGLTNVTLSDIFELKDAFIGLTNIGFAPTLQQIMECKDAFIGL